MAYQENDIKRHGEGLAIGVAAASGYTPKVGDLVKITGNNEVGKAGSNEFAVGFVRVANANQSEYTVELTKAKAHVGIMANGNLSAGALVKLSSADGDGNQRVAAWVSGTDAVERLAGIVLVGGSSGAVIEVLVF